MAGAHLTTRTSHGVTLLSDERRPGGVTFAFTERSGGVSTGCFDSLNLGDACGDAAACVAQNRRRALAALGVGELEDRLVNPRQVHGDHVVAITSAAPVAVRAAQQEARAGADAIVCTVPGVPVLLCFADCVPVVLAAPGCFAVIHSGWRGTIARISRRALSVLKEVGGVRPDEVFAYVGPHIAGPDYEVSSELIDRFTAEFGAGVCLGDRHLDLGAAVCQTLTEEGVCAQNIAPCEASTASSTDRFFSYRASGGSCGRHGALAVLTEATQREV
ncbi:MAG: laccase domain-containing protein [Atopobiaceae bacterium]|nr:laccase domain-containing protein [Atopobiaceae bacterium]